MCNSPRTPISRKSPGSSQYPSYHAALFSRDLPRSFPGVVAVADHKIAPLIPPKLIKGRDDQGWGWQRLVTGIILLRSPRSASPRHGVGEGCR